jgi:hypothetical protein
MRVGSPRSARARLVSGGDRNVSLREGKPGRKAGEAGEEGREAGKEGRGIREGGVVAVRSYGE